MHDSGSGWFATPFLRDSFIHYSTPVYPGALNGLLELSSGLQLDESEIETLRHLGESLPGPGCFNNAANCVHHQLGLLKVDRVSALFCNDQLAIG
jgi:hypothetical protein